MATPSPPQQNLGPCAPQNFYCVQIFLYNFCMLMYNYVFLYTIKILEIKLIVIWVPTKQSNRYVDIACTIKGYQFFLEAHSMNSVLSVSSHSQSKLNASLLSFITGQHALVDCFITFRKPAVNFNSAATRLLQDIALHQISSVQSVADSQNLIILISNKISFWIVLVYKCFFTTI